MTPTMTTTTTKAIPMIPIKIHLLVNGIEIDDEFMYDPSTKLSCFDMARSIGYDLTISDDIIQSIAIDIAEQIQARPQQWNNHKDNHINNTSNNRIVKDNHGEMKADDDRQVTRAEILDTKLLVSYINYHVHFQKPPKT
jgi:hypothetical protein